MRHALVAGAASGIGAAVAARLHADGARVTCADLDVEGARATAARLGGAPAIALDAREEASWAAAIGACEDLDVLVNAVGVSAGSPLGDTTLDEWRRVMATNLDGAFFATKHGIRAMREKVGGRGGVIVHIGSASGIRAAAGAAAYSTSKAALRMLVMCAAKECRDAGLPIRINLVSPAGVKTAMWRAMPFFQELVRTAGSEDAAFASMTASGGGPFQEPAEVAAVVAFLVSDAARHITGAELPVDDGFVL